MKQVISTLCCVFYIAGVTDTFPVRIYYTYTFAAKTTVAEKKTEIWHSFDSSIAHICLFCVLFANINI